MTTPTEHLSRLALEYWRASGARTEDRLRDLVAWCCMTYGLGTSSVRAIILTQALNGRYAHEEG